jgi:flagellar hook assembly protein FlgD
MRENHLEEKLAMPIKRYKPEQIVTMLRAVEPSTDSNSVGQAEVFQTTATSGTVGSITFYLDAKKAATTVYLGLYADNAGHPGTLLTQGSSSAPTKGGWNTIGVTGASVTAGSRYWIAILGTAGGKPYFRDRGSGSCASEGSAQTTLTQLPATRQIEVSVANGKTTPQACKEH